MSGLKANKPEYEISQEDARIIQAYQVMKAFNCLDLNVYRKNPAWFNKAVLALIKTENKTLEDKQQDG